MLPRLALPFRLTLPVGPAENVTVFVESAPAFAATPPVGIPARIQW